MERGLVICNLIWFWKGKDFEVFAAFPLGWAGRKRKQYHDFIDGKMEFLEMKE